MNNPLPAYLVPEVLSGALAVIAAVLFGLRNALKLAGWPARERRKVVAGAGLLLAAWFFAALLTSWFGLYRGASSRIPTIQFGVLIPIIVGVALFLLSGTLRRVLEAVPQQWIVGVQFFRVEGLIFLVLYAGGHLPGQFAWPAGVGDVLVGLLAPVVAIACVRRSRHAAGWLLAWNLLGLADLTVALTTGFLTSPSRFQMFALDKPNELVTAFPLAMIPVFLVPLAVLMHLASLKKLRLTKTRRAIPDPIFAGKQS